MTRDEFLDSVNQIIRTNERSATAGIKAGPLGTLILKSLRIHWSEFGFPALKSVLQELEGRGEVRTGYDDKHTYTVWSVPSENVARLPTLEGFTPRELGRPAPPLDYRPASLMHRQLLIVGSAGPALLAGSVHAQHRPPTDQFAEAPRRLKKGIWIAFVNALPQGRRFMHRNTGEVRMGLSEPPRPEHEWIEIQRISDEIQRAWARKFLDDHLTQENPYVREALNDGPWFLTLRDRLKQLDPQLVAQWNKDRSALVKGCVRNWCGENGIDPGVIFGGSDQRTPEAHAAEREQATPDARRERILTALARMPTHELLQIPIAGKYMYPEEDTLAR
jgi:hypothetical protein